MLTDTQRKMASIQEIATLSPIENSDFLEVATMKGLGWKVVVKKGEFKPGDKVVYFEIDSAIDANYLPDPLLFLRDKGIKKLFTGRTPDTSAFSGEYVRIKTIKLRGQISQGLIVPLSAFSATLNARDLPVGSDLTQELGVEVWDRLCEWYDERSQLGPRAQSHAAGTFPSDVPKTDEIRIESLMEYFSDPEMTNAVWECTEKNDGSSQTLFYRPLVWPDDPMRTASRKFLLKDDGFSDDWFNVLKEIGLDKLRARFEMIYKNGFEYVDDLTKQIVSFPKEHELAIQGEHIGARFNGNKDRNKEDHFRVFRIFDITDQKFVSPNCRYEICRILGLEHVKVIETCKIFDKCKTIDDFENYVTRKSDNGNQIEGVVFKRVDNGEISFKKVSAKYCLQND